LHIEKKGTLHKSQQFGEISQDLTEMHGCYPDNSSEQIITVLPVIQANIML